VEVQVYTMNGGSEPNELLRRLDDTPPLRERILEHGW
jgi:hypothetical protein